MKSTSWTKKPITWGADVIMCIGSLFIGIASGLAFLAVWYSPNWWVEFKEFVKKPFRKISELRTTKEEA